MEELNAQIYAIPRNRHQFEGGKSKVVCNQANPSIKQYL